MNPISRKAGGTLLLVLALAPGLAAGGKMSRTLVTAAGAYAAATTLVPASAADLAPAGASAPVAAPGLWTPYGPVSLKPMAYLCPGPALAPSPDTDLETVEALVKAATQAYGDAGCEPLLAGKLPCIGPDAWEPPAGARTLSADAFIDARQGVQPQYDHAGYPTIRGLHDATGLELDAHVCRALGDFQRDPGEGRHAALFERLLEAGHSYRRLQAAQKRAMELNAAALLDQAAVEKEMLPKRKAAALKEKAAEVKHRLALKGNRGPQARKAQLELESAQAVRVQAQNAVEEAQYQVDTTANVLARLNRIVGRFGSHIQPILEAMSPGTVHLPEPLAGGEAGSDSDTD
jgi:hypothetical protein